MKLLKKKLLFSLFCARENQNFTYQSYSYLYYRTSEYGPGSVRSAVNDLIGEALVDRLKRNRRSRFKLTASGREVLLKNLPLLAFQRPWDRYWRLVIIVAKIGASLRPLQRQLHLLGYRRLSRGAYLSPADIADSTREELIRRHWLNRVVIIESRRLLGIDGQQLARNIWQLEKIDSQYVQFITLSQRLLSSGRRNLVLLQQAKFGFKTVFDRYFKLLCLDPALPKALLPPDWQAGPARDLFFRLAELAKTAEI